MLCDIMAIKHTKLVNLALQGGGSHGAFTWGVLDRLLEDERIDIDAISAVSSGTMNACVMTSGFINGGREGAKKSIATFWQAVAAKYRDLFESNPATIWNKAVGFDYAMPLDGYLSMTEKLSPYQLNPFNLNPLKDILIDIIDFEQLRKASPIKLHIGATQVRTGKMRVFTNEEIGVDVLLASACLPCLHHAIEIEGEHYWDGGYSGNPPLFPLIFNSEHPDIMVVLLQPLLRESVPTTVDEIHKRTHELSFTNTFLREMRAIAISKEQIKQESLLSGSLEKRMRKLNIHIIEDESLEQMDAGSRYYAGSDLIQDLYTRGVETAHNWLLNHYRSITKRSSVDLVKLFA
jgi:NTE family protein